MECFQVEILGRLPAGLAQVGQSGRFVSVWSSVRIRHPALKHTTLIEVKHSTLSRDNSVWSEGLSCKQRVVGSNPAPGSLGCNSAMRELGTFNPRVAGAIPVTLTSGSGQDGKDTGLPSPRSAVRTRSAAPVGAVLLENTGAFQAPASGSSPASRTRGCSSNWQSGSFASCLLRVRVPPPPQIWLSNSVGRVAS